MVDAPDVPHAFTNFIKAENTAEILKASRKSATGEDHINKINSAAFHWQT